MLGAQPLALLSFRTKSTDRVCLGTKGTTVSSMTQEEQTDVLSETYTRARPRDFLSSVACWSAQEWRRWPHIWQD